MDKRLNNKHYRFHPFNGLKERGQLSRLNRPIEAYYNDNGCLISTGHSLVSGYPHINRDNKRWVLSRWIFFINFGFVPKIVMHSCDNPLCINPLHLLPGDEKLNSLDMVKKGRSPKNTNLNKLNDKKVRQIKLRLLQGETLMSLAKKYKVSKRMILFIKQGKKWKHVEVNDI